MLPIAQFAPTMPSLSRQNELDNAYQHNMGAGKPPYSDVIIRTRGELEWIIQRRGWTGKEDFPEKGTEQIDFRSINCTGVNLSSTKDTLLRIRGACFTEANLDGVNFSGSEVTWADFSGATMKRALLRETNFSATNFTSTNLESSDLFSAILNGANFTQANLANVNLQQARINQDTCFLYTTTTLTKVAEMRWNNAPMNLSGWLYESGYDPLDVKFPVPSTSKILRKDKWRLGDQDELYFRSLSSGKRRAHALRQVSRAYAALAATLRNQNYSTASSEYRLRALQLERRALQAEGAILSRALLKMLDMISGHGEKPGRILLSYLFIVVGFLLLYLGIDTQWEYTRIISNPSQILDALVYSLTSFHGRGFFPGGSTLTAHDPQIVLAAIEAVVGLFIEITLIATITRRFFD